MAIVIIFCYYEIVSRVLRALFSFFALVCILSFFPSFESVLAVNYFVDNFDSRDDLLWDINERGGSVIYDNGILSLGSTSNGFPIMYSKLNEIFVGGTESVFEVKFKYDFQDMRSMGNGISIGFTGSTDYPFYQFSFWRDVGDGDFFFYNDFDRRCVNLMPNRDDSTRDYVKGLNFGDSWHVVKILSFPNRSFEIFLDDQLIYKTEISQCVGNTIFLGNPLQGGESRWNDMSIDYLKISDGVENIFVKKYIILPGLGGSWNGRAMVYGEEVEMDEWKMTPFVHVYDELISGFEQNGLVRDQDFFVWNYDWREPVAEIVGELDSFVDDNVTSDEEVSLVGHSLGGLVARMWAQDNSTDPRLNKVMSLGSPHFGVLDAYDAWSGAKFSGKTDMESVFLDLFLTLKRKGGETRLETTRGFVPVLRDLLPVFDFAKSRFGVIPYQSMETVNNYLISKNEDASLIFDKFKALVADGGEAKQWVNLRRRTSLDWMLGLWPDGRAMSYEYATGDGRVLSESAKFEEDEFGVIDSDHGGIVTDGVNQVMDYLDLDQVTIGENNVDLSGKLVFYLGSPAEIRVDCGGGWVDDIDGFVLVDKGDCNVEIVGTDDGRYHLVIGKVGDNNWQYFESSIKDDELVKLEVDERGQIISNDYFWDLIIKELESLLEKYPGDRNLVWSIRAAERKYLPLLRWRMSVFAQRNNEREIGNRILGYCRVLVERRWWF